MLTAIAIQPIWNDALEEVIPEGTTFKMPDDRINSLVAIGAAEIVPDDEEN